MKFICLSYADENEWDAMSPAAREIFLEECFAYDDVLRSGGHWLDGGAPLASVRTARTLRCDGRLRVTDGPFAETKEQLGGLGVLQAQDMKHAIELISKHPCVRHAGPVELRPVDEALDERCGADFVTPSLPGGVKIACLGYGDESKWNSMPERDRDAMIEACMAYSEVLGQHGEWVGGAALQNSGTAKTLRNRDGKIMVTDGPYAETKEQLGGVATFKFHDIEHAIKAWSNHPCLRFGDLLELRPLDEEFDARVAARAAAAKQ